MRHPDFKLNDNLKFTNVHDKGFDYWYADDFYVDPVGIRDFIRAKDGYWEAYRPVVNLQFHKRHEIQSNRIKHVYEFLCKQFHIQHHAVQLHDLIVTNVIQQNVTTPYKDKFDEIHKDKWLAATVFLNRGQYPGTVLVRPKPGVEIENWAWDEDKQRNEGWVLRDSFEYVIIEAQFNRCIFYKSTDLMHCWAPDEKWIREERLNQMLYLGK